MSLLPTELPFELGSAVELPPIAAHNLTSLLPMNTLPFTLSAKEEEEEVPYGSIGWEIVCRSHTDFQTEIFKTSEMSPPTFSKELSETGLASVSFDLDHYLFGKNLINGRPVEDLFDYENLWEIYFDKKLRFQFLGTAVREVPVDASEVRTASVSGNGIGDVLSWASVYPPNFPNIVRKVETLRDEFGGDTINNVIWNQTSTLLGGIEIARNSQKDELLVAIERTTSDRDSKLEQSNSQAQVVDAERDQYNAVYKDPSSTTAEKKAASKALTEAKNELAKIQTELSQLNIQLADLNLKSSLAAPLRENDSAGRAKLTVKSAGDRKILAAGVFDIESSGISARIEPLPQGVAGGQAKTTFGLFHSPTSWASFFTANIEGTRRLVAEVVDNSLTYTDDFSYNPDTNAYWRIREDHRTIIFETSKDTSVWTEHLRVDDVSWVNGTVSVEFRAELEGNAGVIPPLSAYISSVNATIIPSVDSVMATYMEYLAESQARGTIPYVSVDFTAEADTAGATWVGKPNVEVNEGTDLLTLIKNFAQLQQFDWIMDTGFKLKVFQKVWNEEESDPTLSFHKEDTLVLHEGNAQLTRERNRDRSAIGNSIVGRTASGEYAYMEDEESIIKFQRREMFIEAGNAPDLTTLATVLQSSLAQVADEKSSWRLVVDPGLPGKRVFDDYDVGDWIGVEMINSAGLAVKNAWRVVGIAIQVDADGDTVAELTLQSRMQLLAERLQQQVNNLGSTTSNAGVTLGSAVSAATLIEQAKLSNLLDVSLPPSTDRLEGDVLTWTGSYFTLTTPGDKTVPAAPEITEIASNVYYPETGTSTRAQVQIKWTIPLNTDGSTITDGHHYEVRYRPDTTLPYMATWEEAGQHLWNELYTWNQPTIPPIDNTGWTILFVGFDENETVIQELSPGVRYEFQVRAVDTSTPQHFGDWSEIELFEAAEDSIPPPQPAAPEIASSRLAIQVVHYLGKEEGGTFNLPPDMSHLEVHVGGPAFYPDETTYVGKIVADVSILRGRTPVIQTFQVESTEDVWVRVIAVDRTGNKSSPSKASAPLRTDLIDDAHISDLTASKITAGTISSAIILSGSIKTAEDGARAEMNFEGFRIFTEDDDDASVSLLATPGVNGNYLMIKDPANTSATLAGIDGTGRGSFQSVTVSDDITIQGEDLMEDIINPKSKGVVALGIYESDPVVGAGTGVERGFLEISFIAEESRTYMVCATTEFESTSATNERLLMRLIDFGETTPSLPTTGNPDAVRLSQSVSHLAGAAGVNAYAQVIHAGTFTPGLHRILWTFAGQLGNATISALVATGTPCKSLIWVEDVGLPTTDTVILNDGGIDQAGATVNPDKPAAPKAKATYTKNYACTWSGTYRSNGDFSSSHGNTMVQGDSGADNWLNDARSLMGFNYSQIMSDLRGATIKSCYVTLYANHWYWNDGGTARIGTHNYTSRPGAASGSRVSWQRVSSSNWPKPGKRKVSLGTTIGNEFKSGASKGLILGPTDGSKRQYGRFNGNGQSNEPVLTITYVK
jgi:hypothetical protein